MYWPELNSSIQIDLMQEANLPVTEAILNRLPLFSIQSHAVVAGEQMYFPTRIVARKLQAARSELMNQQPIGRVNFEPFFQYISLNYGPISEAVSAWPIAQVVERDLPELTKIGRRVLNNLLHSDDFLHVVLDKPDGEPASIPTPSGTSQRAIDDNTNMIWQDILTYLEEQLAVIWLSEPDDVRALRLGISPSEAGVGDQYFSPWVMVAGLVRSLAITDLATLVRLCDDESFRAAHLKKMFNEVLELPLDVIGYFGLPILGRNLQAARTAVQEIDDRGNCCLFFRTLMSYVNRYNLWLHQTFPWDLGQHFPRFDPDQARTALELASDPNLASTSSKGGAQGREEVGKKTP